MKKIFAMFLVLMMVCGIMVGCNGASGKEEVTDSDELYRVNIEDPISLCRVERGNKIYSLSGYVSAEKAEEFGVTGLNTKYIPYEEQFRDDSHQQLECISLYDDASEGFVTTGDYEPITLDGSEKIICSSDGLRFRLLESGDYTTLDDGTAGKIYRYKDDITVDSQESEDYWVYDISSLEPGQYGILFGETSCPRYWHSVITIE